jgi:predicted O-methyltransferase YrrM
MRGWLTEAEGRRLLGAAAAVPAGGRIVEIGSFRGRSAIVLALGAGPGV